MILRLKLARRDGRNKISGGGSGRHIPDRGRAIAKRVASGSAGGNFTSQCPGILIIDLVYLLKKVTITGTLKNLCLVMRRGGRGVMEGGE